VTERSRKLFASFVSRQLRDAGHERAAVDDDGAWTPGFRVEQLGDDVAVCWEGPIGRGNPAAEASRLAEYALALSNLGYAVETVPRPELGVSRPARSKLIVSRRTSRAVADA
jgi:hypothetical protein